MNETQRVGLISELMVKARMLQRGWNIFEPIGGVSRIDVLFDRGKGYEKGQIKTGRLVNGTIRFNRCSNAEGVGVPKAYDEDVVFLVYCPQNDECYLVESGVPNKRLMSLRVDESRNGQRTKINWAKEYLL